MTIKNDMDKRANVFLGKMFNQATKEEMDQIDNIFVFIDKMLNDATAEDLDQLGKMFAESRKETMEQLGYKSCEEGKPHSDGEGADYDRGYNRRYQEEQIAGAKS